ncbi:hypothetical protein FW778_13000 [Ginsengibacter hankyongi]|uniref:Uncharacterized protein n=1 Tax=Ginsengibacter hankyongi TaxID=2607284 RepID=A0A5J5IFR8_9BACT|nr:hypothetical protein [Ginsengibacter hankyongi]KAA9038474.1 hypothetical protein FW778_13000 [Ginsengibacter hankyongi]
MANTLPSYGFLPWARQGVASKISETDTLGSSDGTAIARADLSAELDVQYTNLDGSVQVNTITKQIQVVGPGDVKSIDTRAIVRTEPRRGVMNYEDNGLPYIEFYEEDFLWRYSPATAANPNGNHTRLRPWLALVALQDDEYILKQNPGGLPFISVDQASFDKAFHHQDDTWAFAHVHFNNKLANLSGAAMQPEVNADLSNDPDVAVSRLLCPRKLAKNTAFTAFVIPAFETGRLAGLGIDNSGIPAQRTSWKKGAMPGTGTRPYDFPVYYQWNFRTANYGDFESLVSMLKPIIMDPESGKMPMDIQDPGFNMAAQNDGTKVIGMEAALKPPNFEPDPWPTNGGTNADDKNTVDKLRALLNLSADLVDKNAVIASKNPFFNTNIGEDPLLVPPVYGVWHALVSKLGDGTNPPWIEELNLDFRNRGAAGLGVKVIQKHQDDFINRAWQQVNKVNDANKKIQESLLAQAITKCIFKKHIINAGNDKAVMLTHSVQHLIKNAANTKTVQQDFVESRIPFASKTAAFRKVSRPNSKVARVSFTASTGIALLVKLNTVIKDFNITDESQANAVTAAKLKRAPIAALDTTSINTAITNAISNYDTSKNDLAKDAFVTMIETDVITANATLTLAQLLNAVNAQNISDNAVKTIVVNMVNGIAATSLPVKKDVNGQVTIELADAIMKDLFGPDIHAKNYNDVILKDSQPLNPAAIKTMTTKNDVLALKSSFTDFTNILDTLPQVTPVPAFANVANVSSHIFLKLDPTVTFVNKLMANIRILKNGVYVPLPELKPVMAYPEFAEAVYTYLLELSKNFILPNIDKLPDNSITLLENNQSFIEAFMVGMNHEMARELLWNEYPTDQRGSYFRQFWNIDDRILPLDADPEKDKELKLDIRKINTWSHKLGENNPRGTDASNLVLVIRGQVFKKYPNTMVFAQKAEYDNTDASKPRHLKDGIDPTSTDTKFPLFKAEIDPDITLFGFSLTEDQARGDRIEQPHGSTAGKDPGWFFVLKERPGHVRFGLDDFTDEHGNTNVMPVGNPKTWDDLAWEYLVNSKADLDSYHITFNKNIVIQNPANQPLWNSNSADLAAILFQDPVLFARHAAEMLPET